MELRHLRYFVTVAEEGTFVAAAKRLHLAQQALSKQIADLERQLGVQLFERLPRGVRLTQPGQVLLEEAWVLLDGAATAFDRVRRAARGIAGHVTVGFVEFAAWSTRVPTLFRKFREERPDVSLEIRALSSLRQWAALQDRRIDVGFVHHVPPDVEGVTRYHGGR